MILKGRLLPTSLTDDDCTRHVFGSEFVWSQAVPIFFFDLLIALLHNGESILIESKFFVHLVFVLEDLSSRSFLIFPVSRL